MGKVVSVIGIDISRGTSSCTGLRQTVSLCLLANHPLERLPHRPAGHTLGSRDISLMRRRSFPPAVTRARWFKSQRKGTSPLFFTHL